MATKNIVMPEKGMELLSFHESGHAMNANLSKAGKFLQKCRPIGLLVYPIAMIALLKNKKAPEEEPKNVLDKATTFVKDNAGKLSFAAYLPLLIEEGLASAKGQKYAKKFLSPDLAKKVLKNNVLGFSTYFIVATLTALGTCLGTKVRDTVVSNSSKAETK